MRITVLTKHTREQTAAKLQAVQTGAVNSPLGSPIRYHSQIGAGRKVRKSSSPRDVRRAPDVNDIRLHLLGAELATSRPPRGRRLQQRVYLGDEQPLVLGLLSAWPWRDSSVLTSLWPLHTLSPHSTAAR
jgi:hypothetical protein